MKFTVNHGIKSLLKYAEAHPAVIRGLSILWLAAICWFAFLSHLGQIGLVDETEPLFAEAARQMTVTGDWVTPFFNGETRFDKPPLIYWLMAITYQLFGTNEWAVRLPSALAASRWESSSGGFLCSAEGVGVASGTRSARASCC